MRSQGLVLLSCCLLGGCLTQPLKPHSAGDLDRWLDAELIPGLSQALTTHPRLRQERFAVVQMRGDDIQPHIDGLTLELRRRITDALAANPGVRMAWRPNPDQHHHRRLRGADCVDPLRRGYFIGIDSMALGAGRWRLAVRILDTEDGGWVKGMSWVWQGRLDTARQQAARESREDELLRGLRVLPFAGGQPDLAAAYFANNLSCLLRQQGLSDRRVGVARSAADPPAVATLVSLLDNYLSRLHQVRITDRPGEADLVLRTELHRIDRDLYQIWVGLSPQGSTEHVAGIDTAAYLRLGPGPSGDPRHWRDANPVPARPQPVPQVTALDLLRPVHPALCAAPNPWRQGQHRVEPDEPLSSRDCFAAQVQVRGASHLFLLWLGPDSVLTRLSPSSCRGSSIDAIARDAPLPLVPRRLAQGAGVATLYALAVADVDLGQAIAGLVGRLPDPCDGPSDTNWAALDGEWTRELDRLLERRPSGHHWTALRVRFSD